MPAPVATYNLHDLYNLFNIVLVMNIAHWTLNNNQ